VNLLKYTILNDIEVYSTGGESLFDWKNVGAPIMSVSASKLSRDYSDNEISGDNVYLHRIIAVTGSVSAIRKDVVGDAYIDLVGANDLFMNVHAGLARDSIADASSYRKGQMVELVCIGVGMVVQSPVLSGCRSKSSVDRDITHLVDMQIDEWFLAGHIPGFLPRHPYTSTYIFVLYWILSETPDSSPCFLIPISAEECVKSVLIRYSNVSHIKSSLIDFNADYIAMAGRLALPLNALSYYTGCVNAIIAEDPLIVQRIIERFRSKTVSNWSASDKVILSCLKILPS